MTVRAAIISLFELVSKEQNKELQTLTDDLALLDSGLDSLCFAMIVARLEDELGIDPFSETDDGDFPLTLGEFICMYETCLDKAKSL
jgi:acyl carrier protein